MNEEPKIVSVDSTAALHQHPPPAAGREGHLPGEEAGGVEGGEPHPRLGQVGSIPHNQQIARREDRQDPDDIIPSSFLAKGFWMQSISEQVLSNIHTLCPRLFVH